jgi:hypothetical protein
MRRCSIHVGFGCNISLGCSAKSGAGVRSGSLSKSKFSFDLAQFSCLQLAPSLVFPLRLLKDCLLSGGAAMILNSIEREFLSRLSFEPWTSPPVFDHQLLERLVLNNYVAVSSRDDGTLL